MKFEESTQDKIKKMQKYCTTARFKYDFPFEGGASGKYEYDEELQIRFVSYERYDKVLIFSLPLIESLTTSELCDKIQEAGAEFSNYLRDLAKSSDSVYYCKFNEPIIVSMMWSESEEILQVRFASYGNFIRATEILHLEDRFKE